MRRLILSALGFTLSVLLAGIGSAEARPIQVTYVGNAGLLIQMGDKKILNYGYVVSVGGFRFFHTGDIDSSQITFEEFRAYNLPERKLDLAFVQHYCLLGDAPDRRLVRDGIGARRIFPSHYHLTDPPFRAAAVLGQYPDAILFRKEMDTWVCCR